MPFLRNMNLSIENVTTAAERNWIHSIRVGEKQNSCWNIDNLVEIARSSFARYLMAPIFDNKSIEENGRTVTNMRNITYTHINLKLLLFGLNNLISQFTNTKYVLLFISTSYFLSIKYWRINGTFFSMNGLLYRNLWKLQNSTIWLKLIQLYSVNIPMNSRICSKFYFTTFLKNLLIHLLRWILFLLVRYLFFFLVVFVCFVFYFYEIGFNSS